MIMTHIVAGYPTMKKSKELALTMANQGASYIEIQIPFSDPLADGVTILKANVESLKNGTKVEDCFKLMKDVTSEVETPILIMTYFNIVFVYGVEKFCKKAKQTGCYGLIVPDIPFDEELHEKFLENAAKYDLKVIQVISPITNEERLKKIAKVATGFVYCVSRTGTTGEGSQLNPDLKKYLGKVRKHIKLPLALGFGISSKQHVDGAKKHADIVVIGSKIINLLNKKGLSSVKTFLNEIID